MLSTARSIAVRLIVFIGALAATSCQQNAHVPPISPMAPQTCDGLGRAQGVSVRGKEILIYGDAETGVLREYELNDLLAPRLTPTGRVVALTRDGKNLLNHPTGLAMHPGLPCFLGNTVTATKQGRIYCLDLDRAFQDGTLDHAVLNDTLDDLAVQGARPEYVSDNGRWLLATSDYGPGPNFVRLYDPARLATASRTSEPGVLVRQVPCGPWVQLLHWVDETKTLVIVQNIVEGRRWRLTLVSNIDANDFREGLGVRVIDIPGHNDELEGYAEIRRDLGIFITSSRENNITFASPAPVH
jgi:hypothetical protein